ncbi:MAG: hypothetical protein ABWZ78_01460 [Burkholderiaceae bacterium]
MAVWLLPADTDAPRWQATIEDLANRHGSPPFPAHVTVHVGSCAAGSDPVPALQAAAARATPITLEASATDASASYFKTLFVPLPGPAEGREPLERLRRQLVVAWFDPVSGAMPPARQTTADATDPAATADVTRATDAAATADVTRATDATATADATLATDPAVVAAAIAAYKLEPHLSLLYARIDPAKRAALVLAHDAAGSRIRFDRLAFVKPKPGYPDLAEVDGWQIFGHCRLGGSSAPGADDRQEPAGIRS